MVNEQIVAELLEYIYDANPVAEASRPLPLNESLYELGILDSFAVIELVEHIQDHWEIKILDSEITHEKFGGINKMAKLVGEKLAEKSGAGP